MWWNLKKHRRFICFRHKSLFFTKNLFTWVDINEWMISKFIKLFTIDEIFGFSCTDIDISGNIVKFLRINNKGGETDVSWKLKRILSLFKRRFWVVRPTVFSRLSCSHVANFWYTHYWLVSAVSSPSCNPTKSLYPLNEYPKNVHITEGMGWSTEIVTYYMI